MLDAVFAAWKRDIAAGRASLMIAGDLGTVSELNARARADRISAGQVIEDGVSVAGGATAGVGDQVRTRQNNRRLTSGQSWVRNGDRWSVIATFDDGAHDREAGERCRTGALAGRLRARTRRAGLRLDGAPGPGPNRRHRPRPRLAHTTREVLYVSGTRGREGNWLYVDTHYDPDPQTSHDQVTETVTAREVLAGVLRNEGADVAAHDMIRRAQSEAEGFERLSGGVPDAGHRGPSRTVGRLARSFGAHTERARGRPFKRGARSVARGVPRGRGRRLGHRGGIPTAGCRSLLGDAADEAAVLHARVDRLIQAASGRRRGSDGLIAGLIPRVRGVTDPEMARALAEREAGHGNAGPHAGEPSD